MKIIVKEFKNKMVKKDSGKNVVEKANSLNTLMCEDIGLIELRFFYLYLSKLNARNMKQRTVEVSVEEFRELFGVEFNTTLFTKQIRKIMGRTVEIKEDNKIKILTLYSEFCWSETKTSVITITCNDKMLPYIFELQKNYTNYTLENISKLTSVQKIRLYEICKQYQKLGSVRIELPELLQMLCCKGKSEFKDFRKNTLDPAVRDINTHTDISISYVKNLMCRKVVALTFTIEKKCDCIEENTLPKESVQNVKNKELETLYLKCGKEYTMEQLARLSDYVETSKASLNISTENYIYSIYCKIKIEGKLVKNLYRYTFAIIEKQMIAHIFGTPIPTQIPQAKKRPKPSYDIEEFCNTVEVHEVE